MTWRDLLDRLTRLELIEPEALDRLEALGSDRGGPPWFVRLLLGFGAWIASLCGVICLVLIEFFRDPGVLVACGVVGVAAATGLRRAVRGDFFSQLALAVCLTAQILFVVGAIWQLEEAAPSLFAILVFQAVTLLVYPDRTGRFLTALGLTGTLGIAPEALDFPPLLVIIPLAIACAALWLKAPALQARSPIAAPVAYAFVVGLFIMLGCWRPGWEGGLVLALLLALLAYRLGGLFPMLCGLALGLAFIQGPGVAVALAFLLLGFYRRSVVLQGLSWVMLLASGIQYYYWLNLTLLVKSELMILSGIVLLLARWKVLRA